MKATPRELLPEDLEDSLLPVFSYAVSEIRDGKMRLTWDHFIVQWTLMTKLDIARTWECAGAVAGGIFTKEIFSGDPRALLMFWLSTPAARRRGAPIRVLSAFETAAAESGAKPAASVHMAVSPANKLAKVYRKRGYELSELIFSR